MLFIQPNEASNSIAMIVQHVHGNMMNRWTEFLTTDGEKQWRKRDEEFEVNLTAKEEVLEKWEEGWTSLSIPKNKSKAFNAEKSGKK